MDADYDVVLKYVRDNPYSSLDDISEALGMSPDRVYEIAHDLRNCRVVRLIFEQYHSQYGFVPYDSPLVELFVDRSA